MKMGGFGGGRGLKSADQAPLRLSLIKRLLGFTRPYALKRNTLLVLVLIRSAQLPTLVWLVSATINGPVADRDFTGLMWWTGAFLAWSIITHWTFHYRLKLSMELGEAVVHDLRKMLFDKLQRMSMRFYDRWKLGQIISRFVSDTEAVRVGVQDVLFVSMVQFGQMTIAAAFMLYYDWVLFMVVLLMAPALYKLVDHFRGKLSTAHREMLESFSRVTSRLAEAVTGIRVTQGFVRHEHSARAFGDLVRDHSEYNMRTARLNGIFLPLIQVNNQFFIAVMLLIGGYQALTGKLFAEPPAEQVATLVLYFFMVGQFFGPIATITRMYAQSLSAMAGAERVFELLDHDEDHRVPDGAIDLPPITGKVEFKDVVFGYRADKPVIHGLSFTAEPGQTVALVGHTGSGKTTVIRLISKFYPVTSGRVLIDGHDVAKVRTDSLLSQLGIVLQANFLFTGSVMDNIRVGKLGATDDDVVAAAEALGCLDLFEAFKDGFATEVGERGTALSLGQRQLVCFARAMLADPRILILDEATSSVDTMTEARIQQALSVLLKNRTSFVVAHRLSTIRHADQVLVLDHGELIERGTHVQLLAHGGQYAHLYRQFIRASEA